MATALHAFMVGLMHEWLLDLCAYDLLPMPKHC